jgi:hypothetical protein
MGFDASESTTLWSAHDFPLLFPPSTVFLYKHLVRGNLLVEPFRTTLIPKRSLAHLITYSFISMLLTITFFPWPRIRLYWNHLNHHLLKNQYFQLLPHFYWCSSLGHVTPEEAWVRHSRTWQLNVRFVLLKLTSCFHKLLSKHNISFRSLLVTFSEPKILVFQPHGYPPPPPPVCYCIESQHKRPTHEAFG